MSQQDEALAAVESNYLSKLARLHAWPRCAVAECDEPSAADERGIANLCDDHFGACRFGGDELLSLEFERKNIFGEPTRAVHPNEVVR